MKPTRENLFRVLAKLEQAGHLDIDGQTSVFIRGGASPFAHTTQYVLRVDGDAVFVRVSRLPFANPMAFSRQALRSAQL